MVVLCKKLLVGLNTLWQWSYCLLVVMAEGYLMYRAVHKCKDYNELPWPSDDKPVTELYVYIAFIVISLMCIPFFFITAVFQVGSYANDGVRLGRDDILDPSLMPLSGAESDGTTPKLTERTQLLWRHSGPVCVGLHIMAAFALLLPTVLMDAQMIRHGFLQSGVLWRSELNVLLAENRKLAIVNTSLVTMATVVDYGDYKNEWETMSPEFINYLLALVIFSIRYPSVFWYTNITFSLIFSAQLLITTVYYVFAYCSYTLLYKFQLNVTIVDLNLALPVGTVVILYLLSNSVVYFSSIAIFHYGFQQYKLTYTKYMQTRYNRSKHLKPPPSGCQGYMPHTSATVALVLFVSFRAPIVYDCVSLYRRTGNPISLAAIIWDVCYMFLWITMWFFFTIKQTWCFRIHVNLANIQSNDVQQDRQVTEIKQVTTGQSKPESAIPTVSETTDSLANQQAEPDVVTPNRTSALRKSKERRNIHVTFEDPQEQVTADPAAAGQSDKQASPTHRRRHKHRAGANRPSEDSKPNSRGRPGSMFAGFPIDTTPDNTLTRNYRHSIRDKCGEYYRNSREFGAAAPAAQSSPVLPPRPRNSTSQLNLVVNPNSKKPNILARDSDIQVAPVHHSSPIRHSSPICHSSPVCHPSPIRTISEDLSRHHSPSHKGLSTAVSLPLAPSHRDSPLRDSKAGIHQGSSNGKLAPEKTGRTNSDVQLGTHTNIADLPQHSQPSRGLTIVNGKSNKPDIGSRDSALPSSNETSSNDSGENVLCSQV